MRINNPMNVQNVLNTYNKSVKKTSATEKSAQASDKVEISSQARDIQVAMKALAELPEIRQDKVDLLNEQLSNGQYKPSAEDLVNKIFASVSAIK